MKNTTNVFLKGMQSDKHPLTTSQQEYTEAMNATLVTFNGNEQMLQNDMGNTRIQDAKTGNIMGLREGFTPVGLEEHGGIMYIASVNKEGVGEIGTIPSPIIKYTKEKDEKPKEIQLQFSYKESPAVRLSETILYPEDKFLISIDDSNDSDTEKIIKDYSINAYNIDSSGNESNFTLTYPYISKNMPNSQDELEYKRGLYKINLYAQTKGDTICLNNIVNNLNIIYKDNSLLDNYQKYYQFAYDDFSNSNVDIEKMINEDGNTSVDYFLHYPCIAPGKIAISTEPENIESFSLIENYTNELDGKGQIYPITLESKNDNQSYNYYSAIQGFIYKTESAVHVDKLEIQINNGDTTKIEVNKGNFKRYKISDNEYLICSKDIAQDFDNDTKKSWLFRKTLADINEYRICTSKYLTIASLGTNLNQNINLKVKYYCTDISEDIPSGTYELNYNPYYFDQAKPYLQEVYWEPHIYYDGASVVNSCRDRSTDDDTIDIKDDAGKTWEWDGSVSKNKQVGETTEQTINLGGNRDGNDHDKFIKANDVDGSIQFPSRFKINKTNVDIPDSDFRSSYLYLDRITELTIKDGESSKLTITDITLTFAIKSNVHHIANSNQIYNSGHYGFTKQYNELKDINFNNRHFIRGEHYYPGLRFKLKYKYGNEENYLQPAGESDGYFNLYTTTPDNDKCKSDAPLVWFIKPWFESNLGYFLDGNQSWAYFQTPTPYTVALNEQIKNGLIDKLQSDLNSVKSGQTFNPTITLYIEDIQTWNIDHFIPNSVDEQNMQIEIIVNLTFESQGYHVKYRTNNKSEQQIYPQYDLWGTSTDGFISKTVPVYYNSTNKTFIESNIDTTNLIDLSRYSRKNKSEIKTSLICDYIYPFSDNSFSVTIPKTGYYYIQGTKLNGNNEYSILGANEFKVENSQRKLQDYIYEFNKGNNAVITINDPNILVNQIGIYEYLGTETDNPIKQSCINYYENKSDYWSKKTGASGVASTKYGEKKYDIRIIQAEGNQESYLQVDSDTKSAPILNSDTQSITLREGKSGLSLSDMIINTNISNPGKYNPIIVDPDNWVDGPSLIH